MSAETAPSRLSSGPRVGYPNDRPGRRPVGPESNVVTPAQVEAYRAYVVPAYLSFRAKLTGWRSADEPAPTATGPDIGLLTFPNSGTSWFARVALAATGVARHTVYPEEARHPVVSRGVYALHPGPAAALPGDDDPVLIKSHVRFFAGQRNERVAGRTVADLAAEWRSHLPPADRSLRLVRNPVDNLRARYHHYRKKLSGEQTDGVPSFAEFMSDDVINYLVWHSCCNRTLTNNLLTVDYDMLLSGSVEQFTHALRYAGYAVEPSEVEQALLLHPPKYPVGRAPRSDGPDNFVPVHLKHYTAEDLQWLGTQLQHWLEVHVS